MSDIILPPDPGPAPEITPVSLGDDWGKGAREYLDQAKARLFEWHQRGASGHAVVAAYTGVMDQLLLTLFREASERYAERYSRVNQRFSMVAQGGYGRGELNPCSDIDLLFLYPHKCDPYVEYVAERVLHTLWDARLQVGNAMRNARECVKLAVQDMKVKTALLDARFLCGDEELYHEFDAAMDAEVLKPGADRFYKEKLEENAKRHAAYGESVYLLEPQLKEGEGGLRDLHTAMWLAKVKFKADDLADLVMKSVITDSERLEVEGARDFLFRVRNALHFLTGKHQDQLTFEYQERIAPQLGFEDTESMKGVEHFMRAYYLNAATINRFADEIIERCLERKKSYFTFGRGRARQIRPGVTIAHGVISISGAELLQADSTNILSLFLDAQRHEAVVSNSTKRVIRANLDCFDDAQRRDPKAVQVFFDIMRGKKAYETLRDMHRCGVLSAILPEFEHLTCLVLHDVYHTYTVDEHSLRAVHELELLRNGAYKSTAPLLTQIMREMDRPEILYLSMLMHDIGKGLGGNHSQRGAVMCDAVAERMNLNPDDAARVRFLVLQHLNMSHLAQRRDIQDPRLIRDFAGRVETLDNLKTLYLVTFADMRAVGPKIWNNWHDLLLGELYLQTANIFQSETLPEEDVAERVARAKERVRAVAGEAIDPFLKDMPDRYFLTVPDDRIVHHWKLVNSLDGRRFVSEVEHFQERDFSEFTVVTGDRPGLFAMLTGVLLAHGMNILTAGIHTSREGLVLDIFRISHGDAPEVAMRPERWERIQESLGRVLSGTLDVEQLVETTPKPASFSHRYVPRVATDIEVLNEVSDHATVIDVYTHDRVGVLFAIANTLFHLGLSILLAKITTNVDQVLDVFYVTDTDGRKIDDPDRVAEISATLLRTLTEGQPPAEVESAAAGAVA